MRVGALVRRWRNRGALSPDAALLGASVWRAASLATGDAIAGRETPAGELDPELVPILGEFAWHSLTVDPRLAEVSEQHYAVVSRLFAASGPCAPRDARILEIAAYAHTTGYLLNQRLGAQVDLLDISPSTLRLGRRIAREQGLPTEGTTCVAGDFHDLPYADAQFDMVYICSALHHTWRWQRVLAEAMRVLTPGGILLLENEPCRRLFCHYRFRANRIDQYSAFERALDRVGILRSVAEPFPNTRPETLFGMVENQTIPIGELCGAIAASCSPVAMNVNSDTCIGPLERELIARRRDGAGCAQWLSAEMMHRVDVAAVEMNDADRGMGFGVPTRDEIDRLCATTVAAVARLPADASSADFRIGLADIFGASVHIAARKRGRRQPMAAAPLARDYPLHDQVVYAFPPRVARLLDQPSALLPDIQSSPIEALNATFAPAEWTLVASPDGVRWLLPACAQPGFTITVPGPGPLLILVRLYVAVEQHPFRVTLCTDNGELAAFDAYRTDSLLLRPVYQCPVGTSRVRLTVRTEALGPTSPSNAPRIYTISYAGAFAL